MTTIADVRGNLADIAGTIYGWVGSKYVGDAVDARVIKVFRTEFDPRYVFGAGKRAITFRCVAYAKRIDASASEEALDALAEPTGDGSFIVAVQDSDNWSVTIDSAQVVNVGEVGVATFGSDGVEYLVCPFDVEVVL
jgi:hypothetical protein